MSSSCLIPILLTLTAGVSPGELRPASSLKLFEAVEPHMGTLMRITLYAQDEIEAASAFAAAFSRISELDSALTDYQPQSELNQLTRKAVGHPVKVSDDLLAVLLKAEQFWGETNGAFDVTVGPVTHLWRSSGKRRAVPGEDEIKDAMAHTGFRKLHIDRKKRTVAVDEAGMQLDLGGIAKGYAADEALSLLARRGIDSALVAASGDLTFSGPPPGKSGWRIEVDPAGQNAGSLTNVLLLAHAAVSTSGDHEQHVDVGGKRYSHIVDPHSGRGLTFGMAVTTVAQTGIDADAAATAIEVLGVQAGLAFVERQAQISAFMVVSDSEGSKTIASRRFFLLPHATS